MSGMKLTKEELDFLLELVYYEKEYEQNGLAFQLYEKLLNERFLNHEIEIPVS